MTMGCYLCDRGEQKHEMKKLPNDFLGGPRDLVLTLLAWPGAAKKSFQLLI